MINSGNWNCLFKKNGIRIDKFGIGFEVSYKKNEIHKLIYHFYFLIQKYFFHDNPTWIINYSE